MTADDYLVRHWQSIENYYRDLSSSTHDRSARVCEGMRAFVERIAPAAMAENIAPGHAHAWLILLRWDRFRSERYVYLLCDEHGSRFAIRWLEDGRRVLFTIEPMDSARWQRIVTWLDS